METNVESGLARADVRGPRRRGGGLHVQQDVLQEPKFLPLGSSWVRWGPGNGVAGPGCCKVGFPMSWVKHLGGFLQNGSALELDGKPLEAS